MNPPQKKTRKRWLAAVASLVLLAGAGYATIQIYARAQLQGLLAQSGLPEAQVEIGWSRFVIAQQGRELVSLRFSLPGWLASGGRVLALSEVRLVCPDLVGTQDSSAGLGQMAPPWLPVGRIEVKTLHVDCGSLGYAGDLQLTRTAEGLTLATQGQLAALEQHLNLQATVNWPQTGAMALSLKGQADSLNWQGQQLSQFEASLNPDQQTGWVLPYTVSAMLAGQPLQLSGQADLARQQASFQLEGDIHLPTAMLTRAKLQGKLLRNPQGAVLQDGQLSALALQMGGLPLIQPEAVFSITNGQLKLEKATASLFGGRVALAPVAVALPLTTAEAVLSLQKLELAQVLQLAAVSGLSASGVVSGTLPVSYSKGQLNFGQATLAAENTGNISYQPNPMPAFLAAGGQGALLGEALSDFNYDSLTFGVAGTLGDNLTLTARLQGRNKNFYDNHLVAFNLNLSGALESLLTKGLQSFRFSAEDLKDLVEKGSTP